MIRLKVEGKIEDAFLEKFCTSRSQSSTWPWILGEWKRKEQHLSDWDRRDFNLMILRDTLTLDIFYVSFSFGKGDCDSMDILKAHNKEILIFRENLGIFGNNAMRSEVTESSQSPIFLSSERNWREYARMLNRYGGVVILNGHIILCCLLLAIQMKYYQPDLQIDAPSQMSLLCENIHRFFFVETLVIFFGLFLRKTLVNDKMRHQESFSHQNMNSVEYFASSILISFIVTLSTLSTYFLGHFIFQIFAFGMHLLTAIVKWFLLEIPYINQFQRSSYISMLNAPSLIVLPLLSLSNFSLKWYVLFFYFWVFLGIAHTNIQRYGQSLNILLGLAYFILLYFITNAHNLMSIPYARTARTLLLIDEFNSEFYTTVCWIFVLARIDYLLSPFKKLIQIILIMLAVFLSFFQFQSLAYSNYYLTNLAYLLFLLTIYNHNYKTPSNTSKSI